MTKTILGFAVLMLLLVAGCESNPSNQNDADTTPAVGTEGGPCYPNGTCNDGLQCLSGLCVEMPDALTDDEKSDDAISVDEDELLVDEKSDTKSDGDGTDSISDDPANDGDALLVDEQSDELADDGILSDDEIVTGSDEDAILTDEQLDDLLDNEPVDTDVVAPQPCTTENEIRYLACGYNGNGLQKQKCVSLQWQNDGECDDPDECENGIEGDVPCGLNDRGLEPALCDEGQWIPTGGLCLDPDECVDGTWQAQTGDVYECAVGNWILRRVTKQWGTNVTEKGVSTAMDSNGNIFVTGYTKGSLDGNTNLGEEDIFLTKWNANGTKAWTKQWGTANIEHGNEVAVDNNGNIFVTGYTGGSLDGNTSAGYDDAFLTKWNADGTKAWTKQWGTTDTDWGKSVAVDSSGNIFVTGDTIGSLDGNTSIGAGDMFLTKWNADGTKAWTKLWGTTGPDHGTSLVVDSNGNVFVTGYVGGDLDGNISAGGDCDPFQVGVQPCDDVFLTKWNANGTKAWSKQWGATSIEWGYSVAVDSSGNIFVTGMTQGALDGNTNAGAEDIFLTKWNANGTKAWTKQWGTTQSDQGYSVAVDNNEGILVTGMTGGSLDGNTSVGGGDVFLTKWNADGTKAWTKLWGVLLGDSGFSVAVESNGNIFVTGYTDGSLDGNTNAGGGWSDIFLTKWLP
ncbi:MAG TPA: SBBP repeat-containing protein [bacterium]|nr:SBBP repeat-containing protein [bacterium]